MLRRTSQLKNLRHTLSEGGMLLVLVTLCALFAVLTVAEQYPSGVAAVPAIAEELGTAQDAVLIVVQDLPEDQQFAEELTRQLQKQGYSNAISVVGDPPAVRGQMQKLSDIGTKVAAVVATRVTRNYGPILKLGTLFPNWEQARVISPKPYRASNFLKAENLLNVANQIAVIAIVAIGMTIVIISGGIDLSVGSLIALSSVITARLIRDYGGAENASTWGLVLGSCAGIFATACAGALSGAITAFGRFPSFIATLSMMLVASGAAFLLAQGQSIPQIPEKFVWLGRRADLLGIPNCVVLMIGLYSLAHLVMSRTVMGRYLYAVGGNSEAARLSGVPVRRVTILAFAACGALAGLGGVILSSQLKSGDPKYGNMYELYVIAAAVVGGTSLQGGEGRVFGTLVGAFVIAVIQNGMNLLGMESYTQKVVLGLVIVVAVLLDRLRRAG